MRLEVTPAPGDCDHLVTLGDDVTILAWEIFRKYFSKSAGNSPSGIPVSKSPSMLPIAKKPLLPLKLLQVYLVIFFYTRICIVKLKSKKARPLIFYSTVIPFLNRLKSHFLKVCFKIFQKFSLFFLIFQ